MNPSVATRCSSKSPSLALPMNPPSPMEPPAPGTPPPVNIVDPGSPFYMSPKTPKAEVTKTKSQSRRTLGDWVLGKTIGQGSMGRVRLGQNITTGEHVRYPRWSQLILLQGCCQNHTSSNFRGSAPTLTKDRGFDTAKR